MAIEPSTSSYSVDEVKVRIVEGLLALPGGVLEVVGGNWHKAARDLGLRGCPVNILRRALDSLAYQQVATRIVVKLPSTWAKDVYKLCLRPAS